MSSRFDPGRYKVDLAPARGFERRLQDRVASAFFEHPDYIDRCWDDVRPLIFSEDELHEMSDVPMLIGCLMLDSAQWQPFVHVADNGDMVFYRLQMAGPFETGRYRAGQPVSSVRSRFRRRR
jgi:hypothetical protein